MASVAGPSSPSSPSLLEEGMSPMSTQPFVTPQWRKKSKKRTEAVSGEYSNLITNVDEPSDGIEGREKTSIESNVLNNEGRSPSIAIQTQGVNSIYQGASHSSSFSTPEASRSHQSKTSSSVASQRIRQPPDTSQDLSRNWLTATAAPRFSRAGLGAKGVVLPVKAPEAWVQKRQALRPAPADSDEASSASSEIEEHSDAMTMLGRLGRALKKTFF